MTDTEAFPPRSDLLTARTNMLALRKHRPDLAPVIGCMVENIEHRLKAPDDPDHAAAFKRLSAEIERQLGRAA